MHRKMTLQRHVLLGLALLLASCTGTLLETPPGSENLGPAPTLAQKQRGIWMVGGLSGNSIGSAIGQVDLYDPVLNTWYAGVTTLPTAMSFAAACSWGGKLYVFGGFDSLGNPRNLVQIYDVSTDAWSAGTNMLAVRANISAVVATNKIYVLGGTTGPAAGVYGTINTSYEYVPSLAGPGSWITKVNMAAAGSERFLLPFDDVVYGMGGRTTATAVSATHDGLAVSSSPPNGVLTTVVEIALTSARTGVCGVLYAPGTAPAVMALVGGFTALTATTGNFVVQGTTASTVLNPSIFQYLYYPFIPPLTWQTAANNYPLPIGFGAASLAGSDMYVFGGTASVTAAASGLTNVYTFDLATISTGGTWTASAGMPVGRYGHAAVAYRP